MRNISKTKKTANQTKPIDSTNQPWDKNNPKNVEIFSIFASIPSFSYFKLDLEKFHFDFKFILTNFSFRFEDLTLKLTQKIIQIFHKNDISNSSSAHIQRSVQQMDVFSFCN